MIELFIVKINGLMQVFKYYTPDGKVVEEIDGEIDFSPLGDFIGYEVKVVYLPSKDIKNDSTGNTEVKIFDHLVSVEKDYISYV